MKKKVLICRILLGNGESVLLAWEYKNIFGVRFMEEMKLSGGI